MIITWAAVLGVLKAAQAVINHPLVNKAVDHLVDCTEWTDVDNQVWHVLEFLAGAESVEDAAMLSKGRIATALNGRQAWYDTLTDEQKVSAKAPRTVDMAGEVSPTYGFC
jgi:hypothetical protein